MFGGGFSGVFGLSGLSGVSGKSGYSGLSGLSRRGDCEVAIGAKGLLERRKDYF